MPFDPWDPPYDRLMVAAEEVADARPEVDRDFAREVFEEAATLLHNGLVLDGLDEHDARVVVDELALALVEADPGAAIRARADAVSSRAPHDPEAAARSLQIAASLFRL